MRLFKISLKAAVLVLVGAVSSMAARMAPLTFGNSNTDADNWNYLINFKMWGQTGVSFGNNNDFPVAAGWVGTASGSLTSTGNDAKIAGTIVVGGSIENSGKMALTTGPIRYGGSISDGSRASGTKCQGTTTAGACADVPPYKTTLKVPTMTSWPSNMGTISVGNQGFEEIDARSQSDFYYNSISLGAEGKLIVKMPKGGRVTRIFTKSLKLDNHPHILVQYEGEQRPRCNTTASNYTCGGEYEGNLLIFVDGDITFKNADYYPIDGTIVSTGTINIVCNMAFAGQLWANNLIVGNEVKGEGFKFVPIEEIPVLTLSNKTATFPENNTWETIKIGLDKEGETDVTFKYCFKFNDQAVNGLYASTSDVAAADASHDFPVCGTSGAPFTATIPKGKIYPSKDINIKPLIDGIVETSTSGGEKLWLIISDVKGANVSKDNYDESKGGFNIFITDVDKLPTVSSELVIKVNEDSEHKFTSSEFNFVHSTRTFASVIISGLPTAGTLTFNGTAVSRDQTIAVANLGKLVYKPKANEFGNNYATFKYKVVGSGTGSNTSVEYTATVNVIPVNDKVSSSSVVKSSSSQKAKSSSSSVQTKSSSSGKAVASSSSSSEISDDDDMDFYVRMTGTFEFEIVMGENMPDIVKKYAVMDMKGQVLSVGELSDKNAHVKVPTAGAYIVKIGLGYRRVNVR